MQAVLGQSISESLVDQWSLGFRVLGYNIGALRTRIGFWEKYYTIIIIRNTQNSIGNYLGPYVRVLSLGRLHK